MRGEVQGGKGDDSSVDRGKAGSWVVVVFDGADERGLGVLRRLGSMWKEPANDGATVVPCALSRLESAAFAGGYKRSPGIWGEHRAGCVRVAAFTLGVLVVQHARVTVMQTAGQA